MRLRPRFTIARMTHATPSDSALELRAGDLRLVLRPDIGGCIAGLWLGEVAALRSPPPDELTAPRQSGCFPMVPYSGRLGHRRFRWQGRDYTTQPNFEDSPHSLHGVAWTRPWEVVSTSPDRAVLRYRHEADGHWPFAFTVDQTFELTPQGLDVGMQVTNEAALSQPVGLGWHPYFPKRSRSRLHIELSQRWECDAMMLPTRKVAQPGIDGDVAHLGFDTCFEGWRGAARIRDEKLSMRLTSSLPYLVVFTPQDKPHYCVEPVSHVNNAIHMADPIAHGLVALAPGATLQAWMKLEVDRA